MGLESLPLDWIALPYSILPLRRLRTPELVQIQLILVKTSPRDQETQVSNSVRMAIW